MTISEKVSKAIDGVRASDRMNTDNASRCIDFVKKMESIGLLNRDSQHTVRLPEGGREQIKLYAMSTLEK